MLEFITMKRNKGSNQITINLELDGKPYGQIWTFRNTNTEQHPWHVKLLSGEYKNFPTMSEAKQFAARK